jgi:branched-chain amino acid transport system substrate-binding protein
VGVAGSGAAGLWRELHALDPALWLLGTDGVATAWLAREIAPPAAERTRFFTALHAPFSFFGYEAMALVLDAVAAAGPTPDRAAVGAIARATRDRESVLGRYSLDEHGLTTAPASGVLTVSGGELVRVRSAAAS